MWGAGFTVQLRGRPPRVTSSQSSIHYAIEVKPPGPDAPYLGERLDTEAFARLIGLEPGDEGAEIHERRLVVYAYDADDRGNGVGEPGQDDEEQMHIGAPKLDVPAVPESLQPGRHYVVTEVLFSVSRPDSGPLNWRAFVEPETGAILRLDAFIGCVNGHVFLQDPITKTGNAAITPASSAAVLDPLRDDVALDGLTPPAASSDQELRGEFVRVVNIQAPNAIPPTETPPDDFSYSVPTDDFAAVNAYYNCDRLFRMKWGIYLTQVAPRCSMRCDGGLSAELG